MMAIIIKQYYKLENLINELSQQTPAPSKQIIESFIKTWNVIRSNNRVPYNKILVPISGGSDSDIMLDLFERIKSSNTNLIYIFYDTGIEFDATKQHLVYLENKYNINIIKQKSKIPVPLGIIKYGQPFLNKRVSEYISRLQKHNFKWEDKSFDELYSEYPRCKIALKWWCNTNKEGSRFNINRNRLLKEFIIQNPPLFKISNKCCEGAKKRTSYMIEKQIAPDLCCLGIRKYEEGSRTTDYSSCFDNTNNGCDKYRPIFWYTKEDKNIYKQIFNIQYSDCYETYGLQRTGCACCPFGRKFEYELEIAKQYEPKLFTAANNIFNESYEYTRQYKIFKEKNRGLENG